MKQAIFTETLRFQVTGPLRESVEAVARKNDQTMSEFLRSAVKDRIARDQSPAAT